MLQYLTRRVIFSIPVLIGVSIGIFVVMRAIPGDPVTANAGSSGVGLTQEQIQELRADLGLDKPLVEQYVVWMRDLLRGDGGESLARHNSTVENLRDALPVTLELTIFSVIGGVLLAIPLGVLAAVRRNSWIDYFARGFSITGLSLPDFWIGTMVLVYFSVWFGWTVPIGYESLTENFSKNLEQFAVPVAILALRLSASTLRFTRAGVLEVMQEDYVRTARAKGLRQSSVVLRHALRNALIPVITIVGVQMAYLFGGAVVMESLFSLPGLGHLTVSSMSHQDYTQVQTNVMFFATVTIAINLLIDVLYAVIDPRIRLR